MLALLECHLCQMGAGVIVGETSTFWSELQTEGMNKLVELSTLGEVVKYFSYGLKKLFWGEEQNV